MPGGEGEPAVDQAVAVLGQGEPGALSGALLLGLEEPPFVLLGDLGCDHLQHPACEDLQRLRVVVGGLGQQPLLGRLSQAGHIEAALLGQLGRDVFDLLDRVQDDPGLLDHQPTLTQRTGCRRVLIEGLREPHPTVRGGPGHPGGLRQPGRGRGRRGLARNVAAVGLCQHRRLDTTERRRQLRQRHHQVPQLRRRQRPQRHLSRHRQPPRRLPDRAHQRMRTLGRGDRHTRSQPATTDSFGPRYGSLLERIRGQQAPATKACPRRLVCSRIYRSGLVPRTRWVGSHGPVHHIRGPRFVREICSNPSCSSWRR